MRARIQKISRYAPSRFQGKIDFVAKRRSIALTIEHPSERTIFRVLVATLGLFACLYVYFIGSSILNVIARKEAAAQSEQLVNAVSRLEREYYTLAQAVDVNDGERLGLRPTDNTDYVHRPGNLSAGVAAQAAAAAVIVAPNEI